MQKLKTTAVWFFSHIRHWCLGFDDELKITGVKAKKKRISENL